MLLSVMLFWFQKLISQLLPRLPPTITVSEHHLPIQPLIAGMISTQHYHDITLTMCTNPTWQYSVTPSTISLPFLHINSTLCDLRVIKHSQTARKSVTTCKSLNKARYKNAPVSIEA